jgi:hypothetical protein
MHAHMHTHTHTHTQSTCLGEEEEVRGFCTIRIVEVDGRMRLEARMQCHRLRKQETAVDAWSRVAGKITDDFGSVNKWKFGE